MTHRSVHMIKRPSSGQLYTAILVLVLLSVSLLPSVLLRENAYVIVHDQLDGEVPAYLLQSRHLRDDSIPELMTGTDNKTSLTPVSYGTLLLYILFEPETAFVINECFVRFTAFCGMFLLLTAWDVGGFAAAAAAFLFSLLNFYPVYGLTVMGQPLLLCAYLQALRRKAGCLPYFIAAVFASFSSLVLAGYLDIAFLACAAAVLFIRRKDGVKETILMMLVLLLVYGILNRDLIWQVIGGASFVTHRSEWVLQDNGPMHSIFLDVFQNGLYHAESSHRALIPWILAAAGCGAVFRKQWDGKTKRNIIRIWQLLAGAAGAALIYAVLRSEPCISIRQRLGGLFVSFNFQRFVWLNPLLWWASFGLVFQILISFADGSCGIGGKHGKIQRAAAALAAAAFLVCAGTPVCQNSPLRQNLTQLAERSAKPGDSYKAFYSEDLFREILDYIGRPQESYKVGSVGLYPSVPLYNGFYCIDGYSNNYDVEYKRAFRDVIRGELDKDAALKTYYDEWGSRCYLFSAELGKHYYFTKTDDAAIKHLDLDSTALRKLKCSYILSGVEIQNAEENGLILEKTFENDTSPYRIRLYRVSLGDGSEQAD